MIYFPLQEHSHGMHHASSRGHPLASGFLVYVPQFYVPLDNLSTLFIKNLPGQIQPNLSWINLVRIFQIFLPCPASLRIRSDQPQTKYFLTGWGGEGGYKIIICEGIFERKKTFSIFEFCLNNFKTKKIKLKIDSFNGRRGRVGVLFFRFHTSSVRTHDFLTILILLKLKGIFGYFVIVA